jgi:hypothetical protein
MKFDKKKFDKRIFLYTRKEFNRAVMKRLSFIDFALSSLLINFFIVADIIEFPFIALDSIILFEKFDDNGWRKTFNKFITKDDKKDLIFMKKAIEKELKMRKEK